MKIVKIRHCLLKVKVTTAYNLALENANYLHLHSLGNTETL